MQLTENFKSEEFACKDGTPVPTKYLKNVTLLAHNLQQLRNATGRPVLINSGYRTAKHNKAVKGAVNSFHLRAMAADIKIPGLTPRQVFNFIIELQRTGKMLPGGVKKYETFVHYDIRGTLTLF